MVVAHSPLDAIGRGHWFKLICGASYQDVAKVRNLALVYSLAGVDCIDLAADLAVVHAVRQGIDAARSLIPDISPLLMVSLNDGQDPHFRKASFNPQSCPVNCSRPCEVVCPAEAIPPIRFVNGIRSQINNGVETERCYGCGRCLPVCPHGILVEHAFQVSVEKILPTLLPYIDAVEIHTHTGRQDEFRKLWVQLASCVPKLKLVSVSCPDNESSHICIVSYLSELYNLMTPQPHWLIWQTDGRSMSGDIGRGTTHATIRLAQKVLNADLPGYVQLAGGTNGYTVTKLRSLNLLKNNHGHDPESPQRHISGVAYGSYARSLVDVGDEPLERYPERLWKQVGLAAGLVSQLKPDIWDSKGIAKFLFEYGLHPTKDCVELPP
ncbi:MAG: LdpA C-terminal domain-containing domain [Cyanobacteria bacterium J06642_11]